MEDILKGEIVKLEGELTKLKSAVEYIETAKISIEAASKIINTIITLKEDFDKLSEKAVTLINKLDNVDFPGRLNNIDSKLLSVSTEIQELKTRIETGDRALILEMKSLSKNILFEVEDNKNKILNGLEKQSKDIKIVHLSIVVAFVLFVTLGVLFYLKVL
jgi:DNA repair exonuclease SbcCD ATPase subunit